MNILHCVETLDPAFGGLAESVIQTSQGLQRLGARTEIVNLDSPASPWGNPEGLLTHRLGPTCTFYKYSRLLREWLISNAGRFDAILINGLWRYHSLGTRLALNHLGTPYYVLPHSALNPWLNRGLGVKQVKKTAFWWTVEWKTLRDARAVIFGSEDEKRLARKAYRLYRCHETVVPLGTVDPATEKSGVPLTDFGLGGKRYFLFLGRLHPMKACDQILEAFAAAANPDLYLVMAGPDTEGWGANLQALSRQLGIASRVIWTGPLASPQKWRVIRGAEVLVLPSHCEANPYAVIEALACRVPVLISDQVNIYHELLADGCAIVNPDTVDGTARSIRQWLSLPEETKCEMRQAARSCFLARYDVRVTAKKLLSFLEQDAQTRKSAPAPTLSHVH